MTPIVFNTKYGTMQVEYFCTIAEYLNKNHKDTDPLFPDREPYLYICNDREKPQYKHQEDRFPERTPCVVNRVPIRFHTYAKILKHTEYTIDKPDRFPCLKEQPKYYWELYLKAKREDKVWPAQDITYNSHGPSLYKLESAIILEILSVLDPLWMDLAYQEACQSYAKTLQGRIATKIKELAELQHTLLQYKPEPSELDFAE